MSVFIKNIPYGKYSLSVVQDTDESNDMTYSLLGWPTERYGFSNNKRGLLGPPAFEETLFEVNNKLIKHSIMLK